MSEGLSVATANAILAALVQGNSYVETAVWAKLHVGAPGAAGTANPAGETTRIDASTCFGASPSAGSIANDAEIGPWASVSTSEDYTHISLWSLVSGGTFICSGQITASAVTAGDDFSIPIGDCTLTFPTAS